MLYSIILPPVKNFLIVSGMHQVLIILKEYNTVKTKICWWSMAQRMSSCPQPEHFLLWLQPSGTLCQDFLQFHRAYKAEMPHQAFGSFPQYKIANFNVLVSYFEEALLVSTIERLLAGAPNFHCIAPNFHCIVPSSLTFPPPLHPASLPPTLTSLSILPFAILKKKN